MFRQFVFRQEPNLSTLDHESVFGEIDTRLIPFQHIKTKEEIHIFSLSINVPQTSSVLLDRLYKRIMEREEYERTHFHNGETALEV